MARRLRAGTDALRGLGPYRLLGTLARGGQGDVLLAVDTQLQRRVCIKVYRYDRGPRTRRRIELEAWRLAAIESPQVLRILDVVAHGGDLALVTPYVPGCSLQALLDRLPRLEPQEGLALASDIAAGLAAVRRSHLVHGDVSARNVLITNQGRAVLADFGSVLRCGERARSLSRQACSPEQLRGDAVTLASDLFALGILLHRMLTGEHPFFRDGCLDESLLRRGLRDTPDLAELPEAIREDTGRLLRALLSADPTKRPEGTFEVREILRDLRRRLPAAAGHGALARTLGQQELAREAAPVRLPRRLIRLPWWRRGNAALRAFWSQGTLGARVLLVATLALPVLVTGLLLLQPGPCIAVEAPLYDESGAGLASVRDEGALHALLTGVVKDSLEEAQVLGSGVQSDSRAILHPGGRRNVCIPQRRVALRVACDAGRCALELFSRGWDGSRRGRLELPRTVSDRELSAALAQLVEEQAPILD